MFFSNQFIQRQTKFSTLDEHVPAPYFRKTFCLDEIPERVEITLCGLGFYELYINGNHITKGLMAPYVSNPDDILYYDRYDLEKYLVRGKNTIGILLGNGFLNNPGGAVWDFDKSPFRDAPKVALAVEYNGKLAFEADESFKTHASPIIFDDFRAGEHYDARLEIEGWNLPDFDDCGWDNALIAQTPKGEARLCTCEPVRFIEDREPVAITKSGEGWLYSFRYNDTGLPLLKIRGTRGQKIELTCGEAVYGGALHMENLSFGERTKKGYIQRDVYICKGEGEEIFMPRFTYHGFQYVQVEGITQAQATKDLLTYKVLHSDIRQAGKFVCDNEILMKLQELTCRSTISNFIYFLNDCPHREKNGWTGDAAICAEQATLNWHTNISFKEWLHNVRKSQTAEGVFPGIVPTGGWGYDWGNGPGWDTVIVQLPYYVYKYEGDQEILSENFPALVACLDYAATRANEKGLLAYGLGDWCQPGRRASQYDVALTIVDTLTILEACYKGIRIAEILHKTAEKEKLQAYYDGYRNAFIREFVKDGKIVEEYATQTAVAMALAFHIFEGDEERAFAQLVELIHRADDHFAVGVAGSRVLFRVLSDHGRADLAYKLITRDTFPSYKSWLARGATTLWEDFQPLYEDRLERKDGINLNSLNHHFWGDISAWFYKYIAGIRINAGLGQPNVVEIAPCFIEEVNYCYAERDYLDGKVTVEWKRENGKISVNVTAPKGVKVIHNYSV